MIHFSMFSHATTEDSFEVREVGNINNSIDAVDKRSHRIVGCEKMADQDNELLASSRSRFDYDLCRMGFVARVEPLKFS